MKVLATILGILFASTSFVQAQVECSNTTPPDGMQALAAYSIFQGNYTNKDYPFALRYGRWMVCAKPKEIEGYKKFDLSRQYPKLIKIYTEIGLSKDDPSEREAYLDTALALYQESFDIFTDEEVDKYELRQRRGRYLLENYQYIEDGLQKAYADFEAMFEMDPQRTTELGDGYYVQITVDNMVRQDRKDEVVAMIDTASPYATPDLLTYFDETLGKLFKSPEERLEFCGGKLEENPESIEDLRCVAEAQDDLGMVAELRETTLKIHELAPTFESAVSLGDIMKGDANYSEAAKYYKEALEKAESDQDKKELNLDLADVYMSMEQLSTAKKYVTAAISIDSNYGLAYIKMATLYGQAVSKCTENRKLEAKDKVVYWLVVDYLQKAKRVDPSVSSTVSNQLPTYEAVTPSTEDKFFTLGFEDGQKVKVDGDLVSCYSWINETTTVR